MANEIQVRPRSQELYEQLGIGMYERAHKANLGLSAWLEVQDPSSEYKDGLDAFGRQLMHAGIRTQTIEEMGVYADEFGAFERDKQTRCLAPEWAVRQWKKVRSRRGTGTQNMTRAMYESSDFAPGSTIYPFYTAPQPFAPGLAPAIPLTEVIAMTTGINSNVYQAVYLLDNPAEEREVRVGEGAEIPRAKLVTAKQSITLGKFGRAIEQTYEQMRRMPIDLVAFHVQRLALQTEIDKLAAVLDVAINGDGNANAAVNYNASTLDAASTGGALTLKAWLAFKKKFANPYMMTTAIMQEDVSLKVELLNTGSANIPLVMIAAQQGFGGLNPINNTSGDQVRYGWTSAAPANTIVGFDRRLAVQRVFEIGANLQEVVRWVERQAQALVISETEGFSKVDTLAVKTLTLA